MFKAKNRQVDLELFTIYDTKTDSYREPVFAVNQHDLIRQMLDQFQKNSNNLYLTNAEDFAIYKLGDYCYATGTLKSHDPTHVVNMHELRAIVQKKAKTSFTDDQINLIRQAFVLHSKDQQQQIGH